MNENSNEKWNEDVQGLVDNLNSNVKKNNEDEEIDKWATWHGQVFTKLTDAQSTEYLRRLDLVMATLSKFNTLQKKEKQLYEDKKEQQSETKRNAWITGGVIFIATIYLAVFSNYSGFQFVVLCGFGYFFYYIDIVMKEAYFSNEISRIELLKELFDRDFCSTGTNTIMIERIIEEINESEDEDGYFPTCLSEYEMRYQILRSVTRGNLMERPI
jgi:hypothetical protein